MCPGVKSVTPQDGYRLMLVFENGERRIFNASPLLSKGIFRELSDETRFRDVRVSFDTVEWGNGADICPEELYSESTPVE